MFDRAVAIVDLHRIAENMQLIQNHCGPNVKVMAVVKADAYGHGSVAVSRHLSEAGVSHFGVHSLAEAITLRQSDISGDILIFGRVEYSNARLLKDYKLIPTLTSFADAKNYSSVCQGIVADIKLDTGMSRFGIPCRSQNMLPQALHEIEKILSCPEIHIRGIYTHFASADETDSNFTQVQADLFNQVRQYLNDKGYKPILYHAANSAATIKYPDMHYDMVRSGIALYGYPPVPCDWGLAPALTLKAKVIDIRQIDTHDSVSYGRTFHATRPMQIATLAIGYADGYFRSLSNQGIVRIHQQNCPIVGRVCMDACMVDTSSITVSIGDEATIIGPDLTAEVIAKQVGTIAYEVLTNISRRVDRVYVK